MHLRIMIFGKPGSGKSTFAFKLQEKTALPLYHLDRYFYTKNWIERDYQEFMDIQHKIVAQDRWIIDGNNTKSLEFRYARAQLCFYFNYPRWICFWRILRRKLTRKNLALNDRADGCAETIRWSLLAYMWRFERLIEQRGHLAELRLRYPNVKFVAVCCDKDLKKILEEE